MTNVRGAKATAKPPQKTQVLEFLKERGERGATGAEIAKVTGSYRYSARILELRGDGHNIKGEREGRSDNGAEIWRYWYIEPIEFTGHLFEDEFEEAEAA